MTIAHASSRASVTGPGALFLALALLLMPLLSATSVHARGTPESFADLAEKLLPSVVNISTTQAVPEGQAQNFEEFFKEFFERRGRPAPERPRRAPSALGSGFIIDASGYVVTNNHVIEDAEEIKVILQDDRTYDATLIGRDEKTDLALLKIEPKEPLPSVDWGDSDELRIGDWIIAIGNPFGLGGTVTAGIVSARARDINAGPYDDFIQSDAAINRGNSGGPMFNMDGEVVGVNTAIFSPSGGSVGIGFAIPSQLARNVILQLRDNGEVKRGWLGVRIQTVTDELAEGLGLDETTGALVASVTPEGPAAEAGIRQGDVILRFNDRKVEDMRRLPRMVAETQIGKSVDVVVWRDKKEKVTVQVMLGELPSDDELASLEPAPMGEGSDGGKVEALGLTLSGINGELRAQFGLPDDIEGVVITDVDPSGNAAEKGLKPGDVILEVDQDPIATPDEVAKRITQSKEEGYRVVTLLVLRDGDPSWVALRLEE
ncbi:DegQ family serine endoprotease [Limibacillus sp. MBR-115]|uniref:DegQ family serine endoprotease n=1 Tax=Limibacillus sp. MBR-115 TaxID=3156465 RepID=UPI0033953D1E